MSGPARAGLFVYAKDLEGIAKRISETDAAIAGLGGIVFPEEWPGPGFVVRNACDPEGNPFQIRQFAHGR